MTYGCPVKQSRRRDDNDSPFEHVFSMKRLSLALAATFAAAACHPSTTTTPTSVATNASRVPAHFPSTWKFQAGSDATFAANAMVVSNSALASQVGRDIMEHGGNAVDAAVATGFALAVTYPVAGNIGGGGFMVIRMADGRTAALDYREIAPLAASRDMFLDANGKLTNKSVIGHLAVGVPGAVSGMAEALARYGTMSLRDVLAPAILLAEEGFVVDSSLMRSLNQYQRDIQRFEGARLSFRTATSSPRELDSCSRSSVGRCGRSPRAEPTASIAGPSPIRSSPK